MEHSILYIIFSLATLALVIWGTILSGDDVKLTEFIAMLVISVIPFVNILLLIMGVLMLLEHMDKIIVFKGRK